MKAAIRVNHPVRIEVASHSPHKSRRGRTEEASIAFSLLPKDQDLHIPDLTCFLTLEEAEETGKKLLQAVKDAKAGKYAVHRRDTLEVLEAEIQEIKEERAKES